jgi:hypothetical protein
VSWKAEVAAEKDALTRLVLSSVFLKLRRLRLITLMLLWVADRIGCWRAVRCWIRWLEIMMER